jgi:ribosomal protein S18 acetylase RimI-like enzyme
MGYSTRRIGADEWRPFRDIRLEALKDTPIGFGERYADALVRPEEFWRERTERAASSPETALFVALDKAGRFVGTTGVYTPGEPGADREMVVYGVYVSPEHRGARQGPASQLFDAALAWARDAGADPITLSVHEENHRAHAFYRRYGFADTGEKIPYMLDESASLVVMRLADG